MRKVVITGASGFIGKSLCKRLLKEGFYVYAVVRNKMKMKDLIENASLKVIELELKDYVNLWKYINDSIDYFFHLSWDGVYGENFKNLNIQCMNILNSVNLLNVIKKINVDKFIFFTSSHIYRVSKENTNISTCTYGVCKFAFQNIAKNFCYINNISYNSIYFTNVFGVGDYSTRSTNTILKKMIKDEDLKLIDKDVEYDWIYIDDALNGIMSVVNSGRNFEDYYIGNKIRRFKDIILDVKNAVGSNSKLLFGEYFEDSFINYNKIDITKVTKDTGFSVKTDFMESIKLTELWLKEKLI